MPLCQVSLENKRVPFVSIRTLDLQHALGNSLTLVDITDFVT